MAVRPGQLDTIINGLERLVASAREQADQLEIQVATAESNVREVTTGLAQPSEADGAAASFLETALRLQLQRIVAGLHVSRQLCVAARRQQQAISRLSKELEATTAVSTPAANAVARRAVLVVDDYPDNRELISMTLQDAGFNVLTAANGLEALIAAYEMHPAVIVMDVTMPVLDGVEATRLIKQIDGIRDTPVIAYTAMDSLDDHTTRQLFAAVLRKPVSPDVVTAVVQLCADR